jgi:hypothetical protein
MSGWVAASVVVRLQAAFGSVGVPHQVRQAPCEMSWKVLLVTQARARDSIERVDR